MPDGGGGAAAHRRVHRTRFRAEPPGGGRCPVGLRRGGHRRHRGRRSSVPDPPARLRRSPAAARWREAVGEMPARGRWWARARCAGAGATAGAAASGRCLTQDSVSIPFSSPIAAPGPAFAGTVTCRWTDGYRPSPADIAFVGIMVEHAVALVLRERCNSTSGAREQQELSAALLANQRTAHAVGVIMAMHHLAAPRAMDLLVRVSDHTTPQVPGRRRGRRARSRLCPPSPWHRPTRRSLDRHDLR